MKELVILHDDNIAQSDIDYANNLLKISSDIKYIKSNLPEGIDIAWVDKDEGILELI